MPINCDIIVYACSGIYCYRFAQVRWQTSGYPGDFMPFLKIYTSLYVFAFHLSCMFCRVDHDSTKPEFCSCNKKLSQGLRDISINKVGLFSFTEKRRKTSVYFSLFSCSFFSRFPWPSPYMEDRNDYYKLYISLCCPGFID